LVGFITQLSFYVPCPEDLGDAVVEMNSRF